MGRIKKRIDPDLASSRVYQLCVRRKWFTGGSSNSYEKMFELVEAGRPVNEIAIAIWVCTSDVTIKTINEELEAVLFKEPRLESEV